VQLNSNAFDAGLRRHEHYGQFTMNMMSATGDPAGFPGDISKNRNSTSSGKDTDDHDYGSTTHAILMVGVFVILFPFGAAYLRLQNSVMWHWIMQSLGVLGTFVGVGIGLNLSQQYNSVSIHQYAHISPRSHCCQEQYVIQSARWLLWFIATAGWLWKSLSNLLTTLLVSALRFGTPDHRVARIPPHTGPMVVRRYTPHDSVQEASEAINTVENPPCAWTLRHTPRDYQLFRRLLICLGSSPYDPGWRPYHFRRGPHCRRLLFQISPRAPQRCFCNSRSPKFPERVWPSSESI